MINKIESNIFFQKMIRILVVEDEYIIAVNLQENLEALGYTVIDLASSAEESIVKATTLRPDLVLMDIRLQGEKDGIQAAEQIWNRLQIPVIYVTGHSDKSTLERAKVTFPFGYILKPVRDKELYVAIETALNRYEREQLLATVIQSIGDGMIVANTHGHIMFLNRAAELLTGWQQDEARDRELTEVFNAVYEETRLPIGNLAIAAIQQDDITFLSGRVLLISRDGTAFPITNSVAPIKTRTGLITGAVLIFRDDTQRRLQEEHSLTLQRAQVLEHQKKELQRLNQLKDNFLSSVSHALRTPLENIKVSIRMLEESLNSQGELEEEINPTSDRVTRQLHILHDQCDQELSLVNNLAELQQLEAGTLPLEWVSINLIEWISREVNIFQERDHSFKQRLRAIGSPDLPMPISDIEMLTRILRELLMNACNYISANEEITVTAQTQPGNRFRLLICTTGAEIPANELPKIFDKFYPVSIRDRDQQSRAGLGLALVKKQVNYLGGSIWAESGSGQTCFVVELPILPSTGSVGEANPDVDRS